MGVEQSIKARIGVLARQNTMLERQVKRLRLVQTSEAKAVIRMATRFVYFKGAWNETQLRMAVKRFEKRQAREGQNL